MVNLYPLIGLSVIAVVFVAFIMIGKFQQVKFVSVKIGNATVQAEVADTESKQMRGLMFRSSLHKNGGMLFVFGSEGRHGMWMMNTTIPLDMIWLDSRKRVVHIEPNVQPCRFLVLCKPYYPDVDSSYVLEVNSGYAEKHGIKIGSVAKFDV